MHLSEGATVDLTTRCNRGPDDKVQPWTLEEGATVTLEEGATVDLREGASVDLRRTCNL